jgi:hypothetical protein
MQVTNRGRKTNGYTQLGSGIRRTYSVRDKGYNFHPAAVVPRHTLTTQSLGAVPAPANLHHSFADQPKVVGGGVVGRHEAAPATILGLSPVAPAGKALGSYIEANPGLNVDNG